MNIRRPIGIGTSALQFPNSSHYPSPQSYIQACSLYSQAVNTLGTDQARQAVSQHDMAVSLILFLRNNKIFKQELTIHKLNYFPGTCAPWNYCSRDTLYINACVLFELLPLNYTYDSAQEQHRPIAGDNIFL